MAVVFETADKEIHENGPFWGINKAGHKFRVIERFAVHLCGDGNGYTSRSMGRIEFFNTNGELIDRPDRLARIPC